MGTINMLKKIMTSFGPSTASRSGLRASLDIADAILSLSERQLIRIRRGRGWSLHCWDGTIWLTQDDDRRDIVLQPGQSFTIEREGVILAFAVTDSQLLARPPERRNCQTRKIAQPQAPVMGALSPAR